VDDGKKVLYRFTAMARDADTQYEYGNSGKHVPDNRQYVAPALTLRPSDSTTLTLLTDYLYTETEAPFTYATRASTTARPYPTHVMQGDPDFNTYEYNQYSAGYLFEHRFDNDWAIRQNLRYASQDILYRNLGAGTLTGNTLTRSASIITEDLRGFTVDNQVEANFGTGPLSHTVVGGLDYQRTNWRTFQRSYAATSAIALNIANPVYGANIPYPTAVSGNTVQQADQTGIYLQDQVKYDRWILTLGGRHDWAKTVTDNRFSPSQSAQMSDQANTFRAALSYQFEMGLAPYVSYSESFLPQSGASFAGNPFIPTTGEQYELGIKYQPSGYNSFLAATVYELTQQNVLTQDTVNGGNWRTQTGEVQSRGLELEGVASLAEGLNLIASYTYTDAEVTQSNTANVQGKRPTLVPENMASFWADYTLLQGEFAGVGFGAGVRYVGPTFFNETNTFENKAYTLVDALVRYDLGKLGSRYQGAQVSLNVSNLLDREYNTCYSNTGCTWGVGRTLLAKIKYDW
jgi:iron complex outermembrane receptor protein